MVAPFLAALWGAFRSIDLLLRIVQATDAAMRQLIQVARHCNTLQAARREQCLGFSGPPMLEPCEGVPQRAATWALPFGPPARVVRTGLEGAANRV